MISFYSKSLEIWLVENPYWRTLLQPEAVLSSRRKIIGWKGNKAQSYSSKIEKKKVETASNVLRAMKLIVMKRECLVLDYLQDVLSINVHSNISVCKRKIKHHRWNKEMLLKYGIVFCIFYLWNQYNWKVWINFALESANSSFYWSKILF